MSMPFALAENAILNFGARKLRFVRELGDGFLHFRYADGEQELLTVPSKCGTEAQLPSVGWVIAQFAAGTLIDPAYDLDHLDRTNQYLFLDRSACEDIDPKCGWKFDWADAAIRARFTRTAGATRAWIQKTEGLEPKPAPSTLLRWMKRLERDGGRIGALVNCAGRPKGHSQLTDVEDRLVHKWALYYWRPPLGGATLAFKEDAAAMVQTEWDQLKEQGYLYLSDEAPSPECVRDRINSLMCYSTYASRYGLLAADKLFSPSGEPLQVERCFERIYMDGTEYEHSLFYSPELKIPSTKLKGVMAMDCYSSFVFPFTPFGGPYRAEMGLQALRSIMTRPQLRPEEIEENPNALFYYGLPSDILIDRDRTLIPPGMIPNLVAITSAAELARAYHSNAKSKLENFHGFVKKTLARFPGRILGAHERYDPGYNPLDETCITRAQYVNLVEQCRRQWNATPKRALGDRSPNDVMDEYLKTDGPRLSDSSEIWRALSSTPSKKCTLTQKGLVYDYIEYRFNREGVRETLSANLHKVPLRNRAQSGAKIKVSIRVWDDNIDFIEVYDEENRTYHRMYAVDQEYTNGLSRWEHRQYWDRKYNGETGRAQGRTIRRNRAKFLKNLVAEVPQLPFRERQVPLALAEAEEARASGKRATNPLYGQVPELHVPTEIGAQDRKDVPAPPPQTSRKKPYTGPIGADDVKSEPTKVLRDELGVDEPDDIAARRARWDINATDDDDEDDE